MLEIMACTMQRRIIRKITESPFLALMVDETTDFSYKQQFVFVIRTDADFNVHKDFLGMHEMKSTDAEGITATIKTVLLHLWIPIAKLRGQCYDGASTLARARNGVAVKIQQLEPNAVFTHCYGHALKC